MLKMLRVRAEFHAFCCSCSACNYIFSFFDLSRDHLMTSLVVFSTVVHIVNTVSFFSQVRCLLYASMFVVVEIACKLILSFFGTM